MRDHPLRPYVEALVRASTLLLAIMPLVPPRLMVLIIVLWLIALVLRSFTDPVPVPRNLLRWTFFLSLPFAMMVLDLLRANDMAATWKIVERGSSFLIFPLGFLVLGAPSSKRFMGMFVNILIAACLLLVFFANSNLLLGPHGPQVFGEGNAYRHAFVTVTGIHPPFAAYFLLTAALLQFDQAVAGAWNGSRVATIVLLIAGAVLLSSRMPLIAFGVASGMIALVRLGWKRALAVWGGALLLLTTLSAVLPSARQRIAEWVRHDAHGPATTSDPLHVREVVNECAWQATKDHWLLGVGQGEAQPTLDACYSGLGETWLLDGSYSTHDQLLHWWLCFGVAGAVLYLVYFGTLIRSAVRERNVAQLGFLVFFLLCGCTENVLSRQWGLVLFMCILSMFVAQNTEKEALEG